MTQKNIILGVAFISLTLACVACLRLDSNLYNNSEKITAYKFDAYEGGEVALPPSYDIPMSRVSLHTFRSDDNGNIAKIYGIYIGDTTTIATDTVILYAHGNKYHMDLYWQRMKLLANVGGKNHYGVLAFDYRGYGLSEGVPTESGMYADADACMQWLKSKGLTNNRFVFYGFSLGTACATELTANPRTLTPSKLILEAPFASAAVMANDAAVIALPVSYITNLKIDNAEEIKKVQQPLLWLHGTDDDFVRIATHGEVVFKNYKGIKGVPVRVKGANHSDVPTIMGFDNYIKTILTFLRG